MNEKVLREIGKDPKGRALLKHYMCENGGKLTFNIQSMVLTLAALDIARDLADDKETKKQNKWLYNKFAKLFASLDWAVSPSENKGEIK